MIKNLIISLAGINLAIHKENVMIDDQYTPFIIHNNEDWNVSFHKIETLPGIEGKLIFKEKSYQVIKNPKYGNCHIFISEWLGNVPFAFTYMNSSKKEVVVHYLKSEEYHFEKLNGCLSRSLWEKIMILENRLILHSSCVDTYLGGICFMGASGIGKSTQSDLWIKYENAKLINGDRPIVYKDNTIWKAYGSPYAGSSKIHINECVNIKCIVLLKQAKQNSIRKLTAREAFQGVLTNTTMYSYDQEYMNLGLNLIMDLISDIEVFELSCLPDRSAVDLLKENLIGGK